MSQPRVIHETPARAALWGGSGIRWGGSGTATPTRKTRGGSATATPTELAANPTETLLNRREAMRLGLAGAAGPFLAGGWNVSAWAETP